MWQIQFLQIHKGGESLIVAKLRGSRGKDIQTGQAFEPETINLLRLTFCNFFVHWEDLWGFEETNKPKSYLLKFEENV